MSLNRNRACGKAIQVFMVLFVLAVFVAGGIAFYSYKVLASYKKVNKENVEFKNNFDKIKNDLAKLSNDHQAVLKDRENLLMQVKKLIADKNLAEELKASLEESKKLLGQLQEDKDRAALKNAQFEDEVSVLKQAEQQLSQEKEQLERSLAAEKVKSSAQTWQQEKASLQKENVRLKNDLKQAEAKITKLNDSTFRLSKELEKTKKQGAEFYSKLQKVDKDYAQVMQRTKALERKAQEAPDRCAEIARQNKTLLKQTANMHYNLGVFYTKNKEYSRAVAEYEKCIELNPEDAYAHFNLGYIYAEYAVNRAKAVDHFRKYLSLAKSSDKDIDWVRNYLITWTAYEAKDPMR